MLRLSASSIRELLSCPRKYALSHVQRLEPEQEPEHFALGTAWHRGQEIMANNLIVDETLANDPLVPFESIANEYERHKMIALFKAYHKYYSDDPLGIEATEVKFEIPILPDVAIVGYIDGIANFDSRRLIPEYKTTSLSIDSDSPLWSQLRTNPQIGIYALAAHEHGLDAEALLYDISKKPGLRKSQLKKAQKELLFSEATYCGVQFAAANIERAIAEGFESPDMYGARVYGEIMADPAKYFLRYEIPILSSDIDRVRTELVEIATAVKDMYEHKSFYPNYGSCDQYGACTFKNICHNQQNRQLVQLGQVPRGFKVKEAFRGKDKANG